jgi:hypothetical protein
MVRHSLSRLAPAVLLTALFLLVPLGSSSTAQKASRFASLVANLSEPGGYFDTDNLISNERSYLQVIPDLRRARLAGGAYIGVGPDTNFSYIAEVRPAIAFIIDVRRDNLLLHLLFKAIFELSGTRAEYLALLLGRPSVQAGENWRDAPIDRLVAHFDRAIPARDDTAASRRRIEEAIDRTGVPLSAQDRATISRFHQRFIDAGLELRFNTLGRAPQANYPTYRDLLLETDAAGQQGNFLVSEEAFQFIKSLQERDLVIPVVGDLSGPSALSAIGRTLSSRRNRLTTFYTSNVEFYLYGQGTFPKFVASLSRLPRSSRSVVIRSIFGRPWMGRPGDSSTSQLHLVSDLVKGHAEGRFKTYGQLITEK